MCASTILKAKKQIVFALATTCTYLMPTKSIDNSLNAEYFIACVDTCIHVYTCTYHTEWFHLRNKLTYLFNAHQNIDNSLNAEYFTACMDTCVRMHLLSSSFNGSMQCFSWKCLIISIRAIWVLHSYYWLNIFNKIKTAMFSVELYNNIVSTWYHYTTDDINDQNIVGINCVS